MRRAIVEIPDEHGAACIYYLTEAGDFKMVPSAEIIGASVAGAEPVGFVSSLDDRHPRFVTDLTFCSIAEHDRGDHLKYIPLYAAPAPAQGAVPEWLPIESAPKEECILLSKWVDDENHWIASGYLEEHDEMTIWCDISDSVLRHSLSAGFYCPSHWMPILPPPRTTQEPSR